MPRVTITVPEKNAQPYRFQLDRPVVTLGRGSENDIVIESASVSTSHAEMRRVYGGYELHDLGSTNGTKLDGERLQVIELRHGLTVHLGDVAFDFALSDEELEALERERPARAPLLQEAELPAAKPQPAAAAPRPIIIQGDSGGMGFFAALLVLILAIAAFLAGIAIRHEKETGKSLVEAVRMKYLQSRPQAPAAE